MAKVTVLIPVYNAMPFLPEAIGSILGQSLHDIEILIFNDASTDGSGQYLDSISDARLRVFHMPKQGHASLLNSGLHLANAPYCARMDADDVSMPDRLARQVSYMDRHPEVVVCGCQATQIDQSGKPVGEMGYELTDLRIRYRLLRNSPFAHPGVMYRTADALAVGGYIPSLVPAEDFDLWWKLARRGHLANLPDILLHYRVHESNISVTQATRQNEYARQLASTNLCLEGYAANPAEADAFLTCVDDGFNRMSLEQANVFLRVVGRFFKAVWAREGEACRGELAALRNEFGYRFELRAQQNPYWSLDFCRWLFRATRVDPGRTSPIRLSSRAARWLSRRLLPAS